jgi:hypothetical protein
VKGLGNTEGSGRVLHFDIENRPLSYWVQDKPTAEVTAIASAWSDDPDGTLQVAMLGAECRHHGWKCPGLVDGEMSGAAMLTQFVIRYNEAEMVTGHYIRAHDLPIVNGALMELGLPLLGPKMASDTRLDMMKKGDIPATQEYLLELLDIPVQKFHMSQVKWRESNRLTPKGLVDTFNRVSSDVLGHALMRAEMNKRGMLRGPRLWNPGGGLPEAVSH